MLDRRGRWYRHDRRELVTDYLRLGAHQVATKILDPERAGWWVITWNDERGQRVAALNAETIAGVGLRLQYDFAGQPVTPYLVRWAVTRPHFGGRRYWWLCPQCGRRCAYLYGGPLFLCRVCHGLTYESAQGGRRVTAIDNRLLALRRRMRAGAGLLETLPDRPAGMQWRTYQRLARQYRNLLELRNACFLVDLFHLVGYPDEQPLAKPALEADLRAQLAAYRADPAHAPPAVDWVDGPGDDSTAPTPAGSDRLTLGEVAARAGVSYAFAREAQRAGLIRPDAGRTTRRRRYRPKLAGWLGKLARLRAAGLSWADIRAWVDRRFRPGHEHERQWPAMGQPSEA